MLMKFGTLTNVTDKMGNKKHKSIIGKAVSYDEECIVVGIVARLFYKDENSGLMACCRTSTVQDIKEDSYGLTLYTRNSVFYIEK